MKVVALVEGAMRGCLSILVEEAKTEEVVVLNMFGNMCGIDVRKRELKRR